MKTFFISFTSILFISFGLSAQALVNDATISQNKNDNNYRLIFSQTETDSILCFEIPRYLSNIEFYLNENDRYKLYPTENMYTFLKLDTKTGKIDQVHWSLEAKKEYIIPLNDVNLNILGGEFGNYELIPTQNMYQFILIETRLGICYHVQWSFKPELRGIREIRQEYQ